MFHTNRKAISERDERRGEFGVGVGELVELFDAEFVFVDAGDDDGAGPEDIVGDEQAPFA